MKKTFFWGSILLFFFSCSINNKRQIRPVIRVAPEYINNPTEDYKRLFENVSYTPLETNKQCLISSIDQLHVGKSNIFILDAVQKDVIRFSLDGKFVNKIGTIGKGPGEFLNPVHFILDEEQEEIILNDRRQMKLLKYNFDGTFISEIKTNLYFSSFLSAENGDYWLYMVGEQYGMQTNTALNFLRINKNGKVVNEVSGVKNFPTLWCSGTHLSSHQEGSKYSFVIPFLENIYSFENGEIDVKYEIDFGKAKLYKNSLKRFSPTDRNGNYKIATRLWKEYAKAYQDFIETDEWIFFSYFYKENGHFILYNKSKNIVLNMPKFVYNENGWEGFYPCLYGKDNIFYSAVHPSSLKRTSTLNRSRVSQARINSFETLFQKISEDDNPIIIKYELKK